MIPTRILLVDDHSLFRESLSRLLQAEPDFTIVGTCGNVSEALRILDRDPPDLVLLDFDLGDEQAPAVLEALKRGEPRPKILMVTAGISDGDTLRLFQAGISGIFLKHSPPDQLVKSIKQVMSGDVALDPKAIRQLLFGREETKPPTAIQKALTSREEAVLKGVYAGLTNKEIAVRLQSSESSVKAVLQQLFLKTGVRSRSQLVRIALERAWHKRTE